MKITIRQTADLLDPNATTDDPIKSLKNWFGEMERELKKEFPEAEIDALIEPGTYWFTVSAAEVENQSEIEDTIQRIGETVYETGNFWE